ncbi:Gfo/Idh/MocA family oxidoreductase [Exilibacterium tricleocarpae]|uniref:Gfo/Idh/MocA family oxidoreductase n=1 Tax=Exilibacterium tricleocarpae TaxID=2591008 RepID=A0A545T6D2_9GAMM|nr:Gfo/Idh/MocA family oxidoreductase [Exilibacterium tricleocarpae]
MKICLAGEGAFANKHLDAIARIPDIEVTTLAGGAAAATETLAQARGIPHWTLDLDEALARPDVAAVILATPTPLHAQQALQVLRAGKHVLVEIPMADNLADARALVDMQRQTGLVAMVNHTRRFNPGHQWLHRRIQAGELTLQQLDVQTFFFRRTNTNALGQPRDWTDHLLWHHACHTVDLFQYQVGAPAAQVYALQGPLHPQLGIAMDMAVGLKAPCGAICNLSLSFNNDGPFGTTFRYICDGGTYVARYDDLHDGYGEPVDLSAPSVSTDGIELCDREFAAAIAAGREPNASVAQALPAMETLDRLQRALA